MNPFEVGFTHGTGAMAGVSAVHAAVATPAAAATFARKNTPVLARKTNPPLAFVVTRPIRFSDRLRGPPKIVLPRPLSALHPA